MLSILKTSILLTVLLVVSIKSLQSQVISQDSRGKDILEIYKIKELQASFTPGQFSLQSTFSIPYARYYYHLGDTSQRIVSKAKAISITGKVTGEGVASGKPFSLSNQLARPDFRLELGNQWTIEKFDNILSATTPAAFLAGVIVYAETQNVNFYDTLSKHSSNKHPFNFGLRGHITFFETWTGRFALSFSGDIGRSYRQDALKSFQNRTTDLYIDPNITAVNEIAGSIGQLDEVAAYRLRASMPVFIFRLLNVIPYYSAYGYKGVTAGQAGGFNINIGNGLPRRAGSTLENGFGLGVDWVKSKGKWSSGNYFIYGTLDIGFLKGTFNPKSTGNRKVL